MAFYRSLGFLRNIELVFYLHGRESEDGQQGVLERD